MHTQILILEKLKQIIIYLNFDNNLLMKQFKLYSKLEKILSE